MKTIIGTETNGIYTRFFEREVVKENNKDLEIGGFPENWPLFLEGKTVKAHDIIGKELYIVCAFPLMVSYRSFIEKPEAHNKKKIIYTNQSD